MLPSPVAYICLLSCFCSPKAREAGRRGAELQGPGSRGARGLWPRQGPGTLWGTVLESRPGVAKQRDVVPVLAQPELLLLRPWHLSHFRSASCTLGQRSGTRSCSLAGGQREFTATLERAMPRRRPLQIGLAATILPLTGAFSATLPAPFVPTTTSPGCSAAHRWGGGGGSSGVVVSGLRPAAPDDALLKTLNPSS